MMSSEKRSLPDHGRAISGAKLAARTREIRPVGAWVQAGLEQTSDSVMSAQLEEARIARIIVDKEARLQNFQIEVKRRVLALNRIKKQEQMNDLLKVVTIERQVVTQSEAASDRSTPRKNSCNVRREADLTFKTINRSIADVNLLNQQGDLAHTQFEVQLEQVHRLNSLARASLSTRQVITGQLSLNGATDRTCRSGTVMQPPISSQFLDTEADEALNEEFIANEISAGEHLTMLPAMEKKPFQDSGDQTDKDKQISSSATTLDVMKIRIPSVRPGLETEKSKQQSRIERALYRKVFMNIERTQVKENLRQREHRLRMAQLKKSKEYERIKLEVESHHSIEPTDPLTGCTANECEEQELTGREMAMLSIGERKRQASKQREVKRFIHALRRNLKEKMESHHLDIPQLCACGPTVWDTNPDTCANNCVYYKNPKVYARALQCLLSSCEVL